MLYKPHMPISSCVHETTTSVYMPHMDPLQSTMWPRTLVYISHYWHMPLKTCLPHHRYMSHRTTNVIYILTPHYWTYKSKKQLLIYILLPYISHQQVCPLNATYMPISSVWRVTLPQKMCLHKNIFISNFVPDIGADFKFPWLEKWLSFFLVFQTKWEPCQYINAIYMKLQLGSFHHMSTYFVTSV